MFRTMTRAMALLVGVATTSAISAPAALTPAAPSAPAVEAEEWELRDGNGKVHKLSDYRGKVVMLDFWATWCGPCIQAMPSIEQLHKDYADKGVVVFGANTWERAGGAAADKFMSDRGFTYANLHNADPLAERYGVRGIPTFILFGVNGEKIYQASGFGPNTKRELTEFLDKYLADNKVGAKAPAPKPEQWTLRDASGKEHSLSDYKGKLVMLDFWATWCGPCKRAMPSLQALHEKYADKGLVLFGANTWERGDSQKYMREQGFTYTNLLNADALADKYEVKGIPTFILFGADGTIVHRATGFSDKVKAELDAFIEGYLAEHVQAEPAENWSLSDGSGKNYSLSDFKGKVVLVDFWATWCGPCIRAMPSLQAMHEQYGKQGLVVIGANTWERAGGAASDTFMRERGFTYLNLHDADKLAEKYGVRGIPTFVVFGPDGRKIHQASGFSDKNKAELERIIKENLPGA